MSADAKNIDVANNEDEQRFEVRLGGKIAFLQYRRGRGRIVFVHTEVPQDMEGRGVGSKLAKTALEQAKAEHIKVVPQCPFVASYIRRHKEYEPLLDS